jgi:hypothetical protein
MNRGRGESSGLFGSFSSPGLTGWASRTPRTELGAMRNP